MTRKSDCFKESLISNAENSYQMRYKNYESDVKECTGEVGRRLFSGAVRT